MASAGFGVKPQQASLLLLLLLNPQWSTEACPAGFYSTMDRCLLFNGTARVNWCGANRACANLGAELLTSWALLQSLSSIIPNTFAWVGVSDLADERGKSNSGWQLVNGRGSLPASSSLWIHGDPNNSGGDQDCMMLSHDSSHNAMIDKQCDYNGAGYVCEIADGPIGSNTCGGGGSGGGGQVRWRPAPPPTSNAVNSPSQYCFTELTNLATLRDCAMQAGFRPHSRSFFYNKANGTCHVIEFTDSQTQLALEPAIWVKYIKG